MSYVTPSVRDYGSLRDMTMALGLFGTEDGASKLIPFHHNPTSFPAVP
jgi:hypothetical protein